MTEQQQKFLGLLEDAIKATEENRVRWRADSNLVSFALNTGQGSIVIRSHDRDGREPFQAHLLNTSGVAIEEILTVWDIGTTPIRSAPWNATLSKLYELARSNAIDLTSVIEGIRREIADDDIPF